MSEVVVSNVDPLLARIIPQRTRACASAKLPSTRCVALDGDSFCGSEGVNTTRLMSPTRPVHQSLLAK